MTAKKTLPFSTPSRPFRGFTLTELLIVIALIALLVSVLLAALGAVRKRARGTATLATMQAFSNACTAFEQEHGFFPGVVPEDVLARDPQISGTENAMLHLTGGFIREEDDPSAFASWDDDITPDPVTLVIDGSYRIKFDRSRMGEGPTIAGKPYPAYFAPGSRDIGVVEGQVGASQDIPDLLDAWGQPIVYLRRMRQFGPLTSDNPTADRPQFELAPITPYTLSTELGRLGQNQVFDAGSNSKGSILTAPDTAASFAVVIGHPALDGQPRGAFVLLSAGPDGIYFSAEDGPGESGGGFVDTLVGQPVDAVGQYDDVVVFGGS